NPAYTQPPIDSLITPPPIHHPPQSTLFPYTTLFRSFIGLLNSRQQSYLEGAANPESKAAMTAAMVSGVEFVYFLIFIVALIAVVDRKSTRLNSSHFSISYPVFRLKK